MLHNHHKKSIKYQIVCNMLITKSEMPNVLIQKWPIQSFQTVNGHYQSINYSNLFTTLSLFPQMEKEYN